MAKQKITISLDRVKADRARQLLGARTISDAIDVALDRLIYDEEVQRSVAAYVAVPQTSEELAIASRRHPPLEDDGIDWRAAYADQVR
jgi:hypothetical protein